MVLSVKLLIYYLQFPHVLIILIKGQHHPNFLIFFTFPNLIFSRCYYLNLDLFIVIPIPSIHFLTNIHSF